MVKWIKLTKDFKCPACPSRQSPSEDWACSDGEALWLNEMAVVECTSGKHSTRAVDHKWNCGSSYHNGEYIKAYMEGFTFSLAHALPLARKAGSLWLCTLITELGKQYKNGIFFTYKNPNTSVGLASTRTQVLLSEWRSKQHSA